ncbi:hypothetical protein GC163_14495 [bacterium]|nr:hypothetical protein [bacterium]
MPGWLLHLREILLGAADASPGEVLVRAALVCTSFCALLQLFTMIGTRWGDHHAMAKSFVLSLVVHLCIGLGWATVVDSRALPPEPPGEPSPVPIRQVLAESEDPLSQPEAGNTPVWQQPLDIPEMTQSRIEQDRGVEPVVNPERTAIESTAPPLMEIPQLTATEGDPTPAPEVMEAAAPDMRSEAAANDLQAEQTAEARPADEVPGATASRQALTRAVEADPLPLSDPRPGSATRSTMSPDELSMALPLPLDENPTLPKAVGPADESIARQSSPAAIPIDSLNAGSTLSTPQPLSPTGAAGASRFTRTNPARSTENPSMELTRAAPFRPNRDQNVERLTSARRPVLTDADATPVPELMRTKPAEITVGPRSPAAASTYRLRRIDRRREIALRNGGTADSEQAVEVALKFLARVQEPAGNWDADRYGGGLKEVRQIDAGKPPGGAETDTGVTGLALLAFLGAGYTHDEGEYSQNVRQAIDWLIAQQRSDGYLGGRATYYDQMYCHGIATYALAEAYGMQHDPASFPALREAVARGVWYITETQNSDGGWRYRTGASLSDMSMFGWQAMALKSAELAGIATPAQSRTGLINFLKDRSRGTSGGLAGYKQESPPTPAMTAESLFCKQMYGLRRTSAASQEAVQYLQTNLPQLARPDEYYWYYGTLAMFQSGGEPWQQWNGALRDNLVRLQRRGGEHAGSWDPVGPWGSVGGRIYSTALGTMCLEVYYRFLPLYQVGSE